MMLILLIIKHYIADIELQTNWMACKKSDIHGWFMPLLVHSAIHVLGTLAVLWLLGLQNKAYLAFLELPIHFIIDRGKALLNAKTGGLCNKKPYHRLYVADQCLHFMWYVIIYIGG